MPYGLISVYPHFIDPAWYETTKLSQSFFLAQVIRLETEPNSDIGVVAVMNKTLYHGCDEHRLCLCEVRM